MQKSVTGLLRKIITPNIVIGTLGSAVICWGVNPGWAFSQPAFGPPPPSAAESAVRGVVDPGRTTSSPANIGPPHTQTLSPPAQPPEVSAPSLGKAEPLEGGQIVARIDGQVVLASEVLWQVNQIIEANRARIHPAEIDQAKRVLLRQQVMGLIDTKLLYAAFRRQVPAENVPTIEENLIQPFEEMEIPRLTKVLEKKNDRELARKLEELGTSLTDVRRQFIERTIAHEWLRQLAPKPKPVTHEEMLTYYQAHVSEYDYEATAKWEELVIRLDRRDNDRAASWRAMAELGNQVWSKVAQNPEVRGPIFNEIAMQQSHGVTAASGGQHDWTTRGALRRKEIDAALFSLKIGQLSNIIESDVGFHIVRVLERKEEGRTSFAEAQAAIRKKLEAVKKKGLVEKELAKLRKTSRVWTVFDGDLSGPRLSELLDRRQRG